MTHSKTPPHAFGYQGSKRRLAVDIARLFPDTIDTLYEPFAGSAAVALFAAQNGMAKRFVISDVYEPLIELWRMIVNCPSDVAREYKQLWNGQLGEDGDYYYRIRSAFNTDHDPVKFLYLVTRCVKNSVRFSTAGQFNQSHDRRRLGTRPDTMRRNINRASELLKDRVEFRAADYDVSISEAGSKDLVYLDPPYFGTTEGSNKRYVQGLSRERLIGSLADLGDRRIPFILSYDGASGGKEYGDALPADLELEHWLLDGGRSTQATLLGRNDRTLESVYIPQYMPASLVQCGRSIDL